MMFIRSIGESNDETGVGDAIHPLEKPLREERFFGPLITPAPTHERLVTFGVLGFFQLVADDLPLRHAGA